MKLIVTLFLTFSVLSCSTTNSDNTDVKVLYKSSASAPSLEIPPDLTALNDAENKSLPSSNVGTRAAIGRFKDTGPLLERVLPKLAGITLRGEGDYVWLEVEKGPVAVYESLRVFWAEEGFVLEQDEPLIGIMKTELLENKAGSLYSDNSFFSGIFDALRDSDERDRYKTRVAHGPSDDISYVYLTQYGEEFILIEDETTSNKTTGWQSRPRDPELEVEMLSRMMLFFGLQDDVIKNQLAKIGQFPKRARIVKSEDNVTSLILKESFERSWNRVVVQLDRLDVEFISKNREENIIQIKTSTDKKEVKRSFFETLFSDEKVKTETGIVDLRLAIEGTSNNTTEVNVVGQNGTNDSSEPAIALLQYLLSKLK